MLRLRKKFLFFEEFVWKISDIEVTRVKREVMGLEIEKLIHVVLTTDKNAYEQIIRQYYSSIYQYVYQQVGMLRRAKSYVKIFSLRRIGR